MTRLTSPFLLLAFVLLCGACTLEESDGITANDPELIDTYPEQLAEYGYGINITDAYYLPESSAGTRLVVTVELTNDSEPVPVQFDVSALSSTSLIVTKGAGDVDDAQYHQSSFEEEYEKTHSWCSRAASVSRGGSVECSFLFYNEGKSFDSVSKMVTAVELDGIFTTIELTNTIDMEPRRLP